MKTCSQLISLFFEIFIKVLMESNHLSTNIRYITNLIVHLPFPTVFNGFIETTLNTLNRSNDCTLHTVSPLFQNIATIYRVMQGAQMYNGRNKLVRLEHPSVFNRRKKNSADFSEPETIISNYELDVFF